MNSNKGLVYQIIKRKFLAFIMAAFVFMFGLYSYNSIPRQEYPAVKAYVAMVTVVSPGLSALDMEELVTSDVEEIIAEAPDIDHYSSQIFNGGSVTTVMYADDLEAGRVKDSIQELRVKLEDYKNSDMPDDVSEFKFEELKWETASMIMAFTSDSASMTELYNRADTLKEELKGMSGVMRADIEGKIEEQIEISVDMPKLNYTPLNMSDLQEIIASQNSLLPIGSMEFDSDKISFNSSGAFNDIKEIEDIIVNVSKETGAVTRLRDIAEVKRSIKDDLARYYYNGKEAVLLILYFEEGINTVEKGMAIRETLSSYNESLPDSIQADLIIDLPTGVDKSIDNFTFNLISSVAIVFVVIMVGMSFRNGLVVSAVIPFTIFAAFIYMNIIKIDIEFVSLAALIIALGMLVDNAIVVSDVIQVRIDAGEERMAACISGVKEIALPVLSSTLTTVAIYTIFFSLPGIMADFIGSLPLMVIFTLMASYFASITLTPLMCFMFIKQGKPKQEKAGRLREIFTQISGRLFKHSGIVLSVVTALVVISLYFLSTMDLYLLPNSEKAILDIDITTSSMHDIRKTEEAVKTVEEIIKDMPETLNYLSSVGRRVPKYDYGIEIATDSVNKGSIMLLVDPAASGRFGSKAELSGYLQKELHEAVAGSKIRAAELNIVPITSEPVQVRISGTDLGSLNAAASIAEQRLESIEGVETTHVGRMLESQEYYMEMDNTRLNSFGLTKIEVQNELNLAVMGREISTYRRNSEEYPIELKSNMINAAELDNFMIASSVTGVKHPVSQFADFRLSGIYDTIYHFNGSRSITVSARAKPGYSPDEIQKKLSEALAAEDFSGMSLIYEGESDELKNIYSDLTIGLIIALVSIIIILFLQFNSIKQTLIILSSIPFCFIGSTAGLVIMKQNLSFLTMLGILSLFGVVVNNAIVLIDYINEERKKGVSTREACNNAVSRRLRPILLSTVTTVLGLLPLVITRDVLFEGMAIAFMSGLTVSTLFTLVVVPMLYAILFKKAVL